LGHPSTTTHNVAQYDGVLIQELKQKFHSYLNLIIITIMMGILTNSDVLIAQHIFGSESSGVYASVAIIAKFIVFIGLAAETVLLPKLLKADTKPTRGQI
jgi:O-antigen/teichoic acid export membrane protein